MKIHGKVKLIMIGKFVRDYERRLFFRQLRRWDLDKFMEYRVSYLTMSLALSRVDTAKVMVYPSHSDSFSIAVAQSLFFGTSVVAYDIPGLWAYRGLSVVNILRMDDVSPLFTDGVILP